MTDAAMTRDVPIMRDNTFHRSTADNAVVIPLGRDTELAFLAVSPMPVANRVSVTPNGVESTMAAVQLQNALFEVSRVRLNPDAINVLTTQLLLRAVESGASLEVILDNMRDAQAASIREDGTFANG